MDDFTGLLARDFGFKPQGKSAPMAPPRSTNNYSSNFNLGSGGPVRTRSSSSNKTAPLFDNHAGTDGLLFNDVFGGPPQYLESRGRASTTALSFDHDPIFKEQNSKSASLPIFDKPVYDGDIFDGLPGLKSSSSGGGSASSPKFDDAYRSVSSPPKKQQHGRPVRDSSPFDDLLGNSCKKETESKRERGRVDKDSAAFDDLLPGFGRLSSPTVNRSTSESGRFQKLSSNSARSVPGVKEDPFIVLESTSSPATSSSGLFTEPLGEISKISNPGSMKVDSSSVDRGVFEDLDHLDDLGKSVPYKRRENRSPLRTGPSTGVSYSSASQESVDTYPVKNAGGRSRKKTTGDYQESHEAIFDLPTTDFHRSFRQNASPPSFVDVNANETNSSPRSEEVSESSDGVWLSVSEIPLFTQPTSTPPPPRPPPPRPPRISKSEMGSFSSTNSRKVNEYPSFQNSTSYSQSPRSDRAARNSVTSQIYELEDFVMGRTQNNNNEFQNNLPVDDVDKTSSAAASAAMKEAMDKAEAKFRQMREREYLKAARNKEAGQVDKVMQDAQQRELKEREERFYRERQQREKEEERDQRRFEKERERAHEIERERVGKEREQRRLERERERAREMERERDMAIQVVERATREARERATTEALLKAERAAVEKAAAQARERAERAAVKRAQAEARERAAAEAKERAERATAEAREREKAEAREREARERVSVARAEADSRFRAEQAAVERAAAEARERAATAARANHQKSENDLESFFSTRANSAPRPRTNTSDPFSDSQNNRGSEAVRKMSAGASSSMRKASTINIVDDFTSLFGGGAGSSGEFQEVEGETEERRKARLERHQRTQERAAKAVAEKNQRDLLAQREQAERHRIAETLDAEIKRWAAGKEGNLRALLSTLQYVLWPECGWQPVSLTDLITAAAVKKVYRKATLSIHPDKVQQKGANLQQKYVAEKVFDLLKEAWNKFNSEELF